MHWYIGKNNDSKDNYFGICAEHVTNILSFMCSQVVECLQLALDILRSNLTQSDSSIYLSSYLTWQDLNHLPKKDDIETDYVTDFLQCSIRLMQTPSCLQWAYNLLGVIARTSMTHQKPNGLSDQQRLLISSRQMLNIKDSDFYKVHRKGKNFSA
jgi:hypothetical protein